MTKKFHRKPKHSPSGSVGSEATVFETHNAGGLEVDGIRSHTTSAAHPSLGPRSVADALLTILLPWRLIALINLWAYGVIQMGIAYAFAPPRPPPGAKVRAQGRIAVIGAGLSGVSCVRPFDTTDARSSAAHAKGHGFAVEIFEQSDKLGGIWSSVNSTSSLQLHSMMYRFFPTAVWSEAYPKRDEIVGEIEKIANEYDLTIHLSTPVTKVLKHPASSTDPHKGGHARWIVNSEEEHGVFDAIIVCVGTCGKPKMLELDGSDKFKGKVVHSSQLDGVELEGKKVVVVGSGASGVEAIELAIAKGAERASILARSDKWIIPRAWPVGAALALQPLGRETWLSWIPEGLLRNLFYRDLKDISPADRPLFGGTPIVNSVFVDHLRSGKAEFLRGDTLGLTENGVKFNKRPRGSKAGDEGDEMELDADVIVMASGFERPSVDWLPHSVFPSGDGDWDYNRPNLYLNNFSVADWSCLLTNSAYKDAIGTAGHVHIGMYARVLLMFLMDPSTRPPPQHMKLWTDFIRWFKSTAPGLSSGLDFFTYTELMIWIVGVVLLRPRSRLPWALFVLTGWGRPSVYVKHDA